MGTMTEDEERKVKRLLSAAAARPDELPGLSPFFLSRLRAAAREAAATPAHPIGLAAWRMLPAFSLLVLVLSGVAGWQSVEASRERDAALLRLAEPGDGGDLLLVAALLGGGGGPAPLEDAP